MSIFRVWDGIRVCKLVEVRLLLSQAKCVYEGVFTSWCGDKDQNCYLKNEECRTLLAHSGVVYFYEIMCLLSIFHILGILILLSNLGQISCRLYPCELSVLLDLTK